jgi:Circadian oscillating protein COP23
MKDTNRNTFTGFISTIALGLLTAPAFAQVPRISNPTPPTVISDVSVAPIVAPVNVATGSKITVGCQALQSVVKKGDREAVMMKWNSSFFGKEFTPAKRCSIVSERLQKFADQNGGTFKGLQLSSGSLRNQPVICITNDGQKSCTDENLLFTLKPENAKNPDSVIEKIMTFAQDGSEVVNESASSSPRIDRNLGNWESRVFPNLKTTKQSVKVDQGF